MSGRTVAVLLAAVVAVHLGSLFAYRSTAVDAANAAQATQLAVHLATASRTIADKLPDQRDQAAHDLSTASLSLHWGERALVEVRENPDATLGRLHDRLFEVLPDPARDAVRLDYGDPHPSRDPHTILGSLRLPDNSYVNFSIPLLVDAAPALHATLLSTSIMAGGVALVAIFLLRSLLSPLKRLATAADGIGRGPFVAVAEDGPDEVRHVARAFNAMQSRIRGLISDRTQALAAVSHDFRTPITRLRLRAGFLPDQEMQAAIDADLDEMEAMIDTTLAYLRGDVEPEEAKATDLAALLTTLVDAATDAGRPAIFEGPQHAYLPLRRVAMKRAFNNLIDNALTYGSVARVNLQDATETVRVIIDDDGPGVPEAELERVFQPFLRLDSSRNRQTGGVGLGLAIVRQAIERENGSIRLLNRAEGGLRAEVSIPRQATTLDVPVQKPDNGGATRLPLPRQPDAS